MSKSCQSERKSKSSQPVKRQIWDSERELPRHLGFKLQPCKYCKRTFFANRLDYHQEICRERQLQPKRPVFDSVKSRLQGSGAEFFQTPVSENEMKRPLNPNWQENRLLYVGRLASVKVDANKANAEAIKAAAKGQQLSKLNNYVQCPICGRRFEAHVAARHIPHCTTYVCPNIPSSSKPTRTSAPRRSRSLTLRKQTSKMVQQHSQDSANKPKGI